MKINWIAVSIIVVGVLALLVFVTHKPVVSIGAPGDGSYVQMDTSTASVTTTAGGLPALVLARNTGRSVADICSLNSNATTTWLYFQNFASPTAANATVVPNKGYGLLPGQCYAIRGSNLYITDVWASSTVANQTLTTVSQ